MKLSILCPTRVCQALIQKYANDPRHKMIGFVWKCGEWIKVPTDPPKKMKSASGVKTP